MLRRFAWTLVVLSLTPRAMAEDDPWAPGASIEPWPLVARLQRADVEVGVARAALADVDPIVRSAAVAALGRIRPPGVRSSMLPLLKDGDMGVRRAAVWAILQLDAPLDRDILESAFAFHPPAEPQALAVHGVPSQLLSGDTRLLSRWIQKVDPAEVRPALRAEWSSRVTRTTVTTETAEINSGDIVRAKAVVVTSAGSQPVELRPTGHIRPLDAYVSPRERPESPAAPWQELVVRTSNGDRPERLTLSPPGQSVVDLSFALDGFDPGVYELDLLVGANPILLRLRRDDRDEARVREALAKVDDAEGRAEALDTLAQLRVTTAAPRLRASLDEAIGRYGFGFNALEAAWALVHLKDAAAAEKIADNLVANPRLRLPWSGWPVECDSPIVAKLGAAGARRLDALTTSWRDAAGSERQDCLVRVLSDRRAPARSAVDRARLEILSTVTPALASGQGSRESPLLGVLRGAIVGAVNDHPVEVAAALAAWSSGAPEFVGLLQSAQSSGSPRTKSQLLTALWAKLPASGPADARAAIAFAADEEAITLPAAAAAQLATAQEALRECQAVHGWQWLVPPAVVDGTRERAHELLGRVPDERLAVAVAELDVLGGRFSQALDTLPATPLRTIGIDRDRLEADSHRVRGLALAALGRPSAARAELDAAIAKLSYGDSADGMQSVRRRVDELAGARGLAAKVLPRTTARLWAPYAVQAGRILALDHMELRAWTPGAESTLVGVEPYAVDAVAELTADASVVARANGALVRFDKGRAFSTWTVPMGEAIANTTGALKANTAVVLARGEGGTFRVFDASSGALRWHGTGRDAALVADGDALLLATEGLLQVISTRDSQVRSRAAPLYGREATIAAVSSSVAVTCDATGGIEVYSLPGLQRLWLVDLKPLVPHGYLQSDTVRIALTSEVVAVAAWDQLFAFGVSDGRRLWSQALSDPARPDRTEGRVAARPDGSLWWWAAGRKGVDLFLLSKDGRIVGQTVAPGEVLPMDDGAVFLTSTYGEISLVTNAPPDTAP